MPQYGPSMSARGTARIVLVVTAILVGAAVWAASAVQRRSADSARHDQVDVQMLLTGMLEMQTAVRGFQLTGREESLESFADGHAAFDDAYAALHQRLDGTAAERLVALNDTAGRWQKEADRVVLQVRQEGAGQVAGVEVRKRMFDGFREQQAQLMDTIDERRRTAASTATIGAVVLALALALLIGFVGDRLVGRRDRTARARNEAELAYRQTQTAFTESMQLVDGEVEAHHLLQRHLERSIPGSQVVVLNRNNSADRLEPTTVVADAGIAERLDGAQPRSCLAVRLGREHGHVASAEPLMECEICGRTPGGATCRPLVVGSEVIGSVLTTHPEPLGDSELTRLRDSIAQAAPALANLRNLAMAELRASTDALTGLPNRRAVTDTLKRMVAQSARTGLPLSVLMIDLDHFKTINDLYGHEAGDEALAAVAALLSDSLRASDFVGRQGGEEFVVLLPATATDGATVVAENIRSGIEQLQVPAIEHRLSTSIGVATLPDVASSGPAVVRMADRALYAAKERGRNRVELAFNPRRDSDDVVLEES